MFGNVYLGSTFEQKGENHHVYGTRRNVEDIILSIMLVSKVNFQEIEALELFVWLQAALRFWALSGKPVQDILIILTKKYFLGYAGFQEWSLIFIDILKEHIEDAFTQINFRNLWFLDSSYFSSCT